MLDYLQQPFIQRALISGLLVGITTGFISIFVVLRKMSFIGVGISHSLFGAVALAYILSLPIPPSMIIFSVLIGLLLFQVKKRVTVDASIGIIFAFSMAIGVVLIKITPGYGVDIMGFLFGSIISIDRITFIYTIVMTLLVFFSLLFLRKEFIYISFDEEIAKVYGIKTEIIDRLFFVLLSITIAMGIKVLGIILISTVIVIPGTFALFFTDNYLKAILLAIIMNVFSIITGIFISILLNTPSGATIIILEVIIFFFAFLLRK